MLINFSVSNYLSFKDKMTFSMVASKRGELEDENVFQVDDKLRLLRSAVIYGANASGKSNLIKAMTFVRGFVLNSAKTQVTDEIDVTNFKLDEGHSKRPSFFEINFIYNKVKYRYGFEVDRKKVYKEWLYFVPNVQELLLFYRDKGEYKIGPKFRNEAKGLIRKIRDNVLFVSVAAQFNGPISTNICKWFDKFRTLFGRDTDTVVTDFTLDRLKDKDYKEDILKFVKIADLGIEDISAERIKIKSETEIINVPKQFKELIMKTGGILMGRKIVTTHLKKKGEKKIPEYFDLEKEESEGTKKIFAIAGPIFFTLKNNSILLFDEFVSNLHPKLARAIIKLFNSKLTNPGNAQLIFDSHDITLLDIELLRRDQIWFTEKNEDGATDLYSLAEFKGIRKDASHAKNYLLGKYGSIPFIRDFTNIAE